MIDLSIIFLVIWYFKEIYLIYLKKISLKFCVITHFEPLFFLFFKKINKKIGKQKIDNKGKRFQDNKGSSVLKEDYPNERKK